jgi:hypothetical protein
MMKEVGGVLGPDDDRVNVLGAKLPEAADEMVGIVGQQLRAPGGADDFGWSVNGHLSWDGGRL